MTDPDDIAARLWAVSKDRNLYPNWESVPVAVKEIWRASYIIFAEALERAGYVIAPAEGKGMK
jgi:hypothetical protein